MRYRLDPVAARQFHRTLLRPAATIRLDADLADKLSEAWDDGEGVLDLSKHLDDALFLAALAEQLVVVAYEGDRAFFKTFTDLAKKIVTTCNLSVVDRLAAIFEQPPPKAIHKSERTDHRAIAFQRAQEKRRLPPDPDVG